MLNNLKPKSEFSRNVLTLMTGTTIAQAIPIAISPILTRIYTPEDFGMFALYMSVASILSVVATGRYELAIMLPKKDEDAINIVALSIIISFFVSFMALLIVFFLNSQITSLLGNPEISSWLYFIPITVLLTGIYQSFNYWSNRKKQYKRLATSRVVQSGASSTTNLGMGFGGFGASGLILGGVLGQLFANFLLMRQNLNLGFYKQISIEKILKNFKKYIKQPKFVLPTSFLDVLSLKIPIFAISSIYNNAMLLGYYALVERVLSLPMGIVGNAVGQNFYQDFSDKINNKDYKNAKVILIKIWSVLFLLGIMPSILIFLYAQDMFTFVFGEDWREAGEIASILIWMFFFSFISSPTSSAFMVLNLQKIGLYFGFIVLIYRGLIFYISDDFTDALILLVAIEAIQMTIYNIIIWRNL